MFEASQLGAALIGTALIGYSCLASAAIASNPQSKLKSFEPRWKYGQKASLVGKVVLINLYAWLGVVLLTAALELPSISKVALSFFGVSLILMFYARLADL